MDKIRLWQLLQYYDMNESPGNRIQVVSLDHEWGDADELFVDSEILEPFYDYIVADLRCEKSFIDGSPVLRVSLKNVCQSWKQLLDGKAA